MNLIFVKSGKLFENFALYKFLKRTQFLMRQQLVQFIMDPINHWIQFLDGTSPTQFLNGASLTTNKNNKNKLCF